MTTPAGPPAEVSGTAVAIADRTAVSRLVLGIISVLALLVGGIGAAVGIDFLQVAGLVTFCLLGIGVAPWQRNVRLRLASRLALSGLVSFSTLILLGTIMVLAGRWYPVPAFILVLVVTLPLHAIGLLRAMRDWQAQRVRPPIGADLDEPVAARARQLQWAPVAVAAVGGLACLISALTHQHLDPQFGGFINQIGPLWFVGLALILLSFTLSAGGSEVQLAVSVLLLLLALTLTPGLVYDGARSQSAYKHVDLIQQIRTLHELDSSVNVYNHWPGFFAGLAWLCDLAGIRDPMVLARFWPALLGLFRLVALRYLFGKLLRTPYQVWLGVGLAILVDALNADYFSPQSVGFVMGVAVYGLMLAPSRTPARIVVLLVAGFALAVSHQLSPYIVGGVMVVFVLFRQLRPWWTPALVLGPALIWAGVHFQDLRGFLTVGQIGDASNFLPPSTPVSTGLQRLPIVGYTTDALLGCVLIAGLLALLALAIHRRERIFWTMAVAAAVGLAFVFINAYGREGIFRAVLFALPWLALMAAHLVKPAPRMAQRLPWLAVAAVLSAFFFVSSFGLDRISVVSKGDVAGFQYYENQGPDQSGRYNYLLNLGTGDVPFAVPRNLSTHQLVSRNNVKLPVDQLLNVAPATQVQQLTTALLAYSHQTVARANLYAFWSPTTSNYQLAYGIESPEKFAQLRDAFAASAYWRPAFTQDGTVVFHFIGASYPVS